MVSDYKPLRCMWCGHTFHPLECKEDHVLWCSGRPADAITETMNTK